MYKGPTGKENGGKIECGRWEMGREGENNGGKMGTTVTDNNKKIVLLKKLLCQFLFLQ